MIELTENSFDDVVVFLQMKKAEGNQVLREVDLIMIDAQRLMAILQTLSSHTLEELQKYLASPPKRVSGHRAPRHPDPPSTLIAGRLTFDR